MIEQAKEVAQRLRSGTPVFLSFTRTQLAGTIDTLVLEVERLTKVGVGPVAILHPSKDKAISMEDFAAQPAWVQEHWQDGEKLVPVSALAGLRAENERLKQSVLDELPVLEKLNSRFGEVCIERDKLRADNDSLSQSLHKWIAANAPGGWIDTLRAQLEQAHEVLDVDDSKIIRNAKDGYPEWREPRELTLAERVQALCTYASDWKRWCEQAQAENEQWHSKWSAMEEASIRQFQRVVKLAEERGTLRAENERLKGEMVEYNCRIAKELESLVDKNDTLRAQLEQAQARIQEQALQLVSAFAQADEAQADAVRLRAKVQELVALLDEATAYTSCASWSPSLTQEMNAATNAARAALEPKT